MAVPSARDIILRLHERRDGDALVRAAADLDRLGRGMDATGDRADGFTHDMKEVNAELDRTDRHIRDLNRRKLTIGGGFDFSQSHAETRALAIAALVEIGAIVAPLVGAMVAGAVVGAVGVGGIVGGTVAAAKHPQVREAFKELGAQMGRDIRDDAAVLVDPLVKAAHILEKEWRKTSGSLESIFRTLAPAVEPLTRGLSGFVNEALVGLHEAAEAAVPILRDMEVLLPELGRAFSDFFEILADPNTGAREGFRDLITVTSGFVRGLGATIGGLSASWNQFRNMPDWVKIASLAIPSIGLTAGTINFLRNAQDAYNKALQETNHAQGLLNPVFKASIDDLDNMRHHFEAAERAAVVFDKALDKSYTTFLDWIGAAIDVEAALDGFAEGVLEHGRTLDIDTEAGRENLSMLKRIAEGAIEASKNKLIETGNVHLAQAEYDKYRQKLFDTAIVLGYTADEAQRLVDKWLAMQNLEDITKAINIRINLPRGVTFGPSTGSFGGGLQEFASGGTVGGPVGAPQLAVVHGGEMVLTPQQQRMGGGGTVEVVISSGGSAIDDLLVQIISRSVQIRGGDGAVLGVRTVSG